MGTANKIGMEVPLCNYVAKDRIWRDHCINETIRTKLWEENWGFLRLTLDQLLDSEKEKYIDSSRKKPYIPDNLKIREVIPVSEFIKIKASPKPFPETTSRLIGWRSGDKDYCLEKYNMVKKGQGCLLKRFNWPQEAIW